jgi:hypothetical protein
MMNQKPNSTTTEDGKQASDGNSLGTHHADKKPLNVHFSRTFCSSQTLLILSSKATNLHVKKLSFFPYLIQEIEP